MSSKEITVPDIGTKDAVDIIEIHVKPGDSIQQDDTIIVLESDKATMEIPAPQAGVVGELKVKVGDAVKTGDLILTLQAAEAIAEVKPAVQPVAAAPAAAEKAPAPELAAQPKAAVNSVSKDIPVPDLGTKDAVEIIEVHVKAGDSINKDDTLIVLESDKATMEIPAPEGGTVGAIKVKVGDSVKTGDIILTLSGASDSASASVPIASPAVSAPAPAVKAESVVAPAAAMSASTSAPAMASAPSKDVHAGPAVRRVARELGVDLAQVTGSGPRARILKEDVHAWVKARLSAPLAPSGAAVAATTGSGLPELPDIDFASWGEVERQELSRINRVSASNLHRAWLHIPHVTQFDEADITELEAFRKNEAAALKDKGIRLTILAFLVKAVAKSLQQFPRFNSSMSKDGSALILKKYYHIGIAVDTPNGLVVPVIRDADKKSVLDIAQEMQVISVKARDKKLTPADMQGGCFSISSLGGIGGTAFTPIVNWPEVSILGVSKMSTKPHWDGKSFVPRLMLPLSLSYDHRVIDGAEAARFITHLSQSLNDIRRLLL